jgi:hypothetical protein
MIKVLVGTSLHRPLMLIFLVVKDQAHLLTIYGGWLLIPMVSPYSATYVLETSFRQCDGLSLGLYIYIVARVKAKANHGI